MMLVSDRTCFACNRAFFFDRAFVSAVIQQDLIKPALSSAQSKPPASFPIPPQTAAPTPTPPPSRATVETACRPFRMPACSARWACSAATIPTTPPGRSRSPSAGRRPPRLPSPAQSPTRSTSRTPRASCAPRMRACRRPPPRRAAAPAHRDPGSPPRAPAGHRGPDPALASPRGLQGRLQGGHRHRGGRAGEPDQDQGRQEGLRRRRLRDRGPPPGRPPGRRSRQAPADPRTRRVAPTKALPAGSLRRRQCSVYAYLDGRRMA